MRAGSVLFGLFLTIVAFEVQAQSFDQLLRSILEVGQSVDRAAKRQAREQEYRWLVVASRENPQEAIELANNFVPILGDVSVVQAANGRFAVIVGFLTVAKAKANTEALKAIRLVPQDSFLSGGERFHQIVWSSGSEFASVELVRRPALRRTVTRLQRALSRLGLYSGDIDGAVGPATSSAFRNFTERFAPQTWDSLDDYVLTSIEQTSADGFRSEQERNDARGRGFQDAAAMSQALAAGFSTQAEFSEARRQGFSSKFDFEQFRSSGFQTKNEFDEAKGQGFTSKAAYDAHQGKLRAELSVRAAEILDDAEQFLRINPQTKNIVEIAGAAAALKAASGAGRNREIIDRLEQLTRHLSEVDGFEAFAKARAEERIAKRRDEISRLREQLDQQRVAIRLWMAQNLMHQATADLADEMAIVDKAIDGGDLEMLDKSAKSLADLLTRWDLKPDIDKLVASGGSASAVTEMPEYTIAQTPLNAFLLNGNGDERIALYNASSSAPSIIRNLVGDFAFEKETAKVCLVPADQDPSLARAISQELANLDAERVDISRSPCSADRLLNYDVMLLTRRDFLKSETVFALRVLNLLESRDLREFSALSHAALKKRQDAEAEARKSVARDVEAGTRNGYGAVTIVDGGPLLCAVVPEAAHEHGPSIVDSRTFIEGETRKRLKIAFFDAEGAYRATQRRDCSGIYASGADLKLISAALERDGRAFEFSPIWIEAAALAEVREHRLQEDSQRQAEIDAKRLAAEEQKKVSEEQERRRKADAVQKEKSLQEKNGAMVRALQSRLTEGFERIVLSHKDTAKNELVDRFVAQAAMMFPQFMAWNSKLEDELWRTKDLMTDVLDYGTGSWGDRQLEQIVLRLEVDIESEQRGEKRTACFWLGMIVDDEFKSYRDGLDAGCDDDEALARWKKLHAFESLWRAE